MSRRVLPSRSTRGFKSVQSSQQEKKDNQLYAQMFGHDLDDDEDYILKQAKENARKERTLQNLQKYSYARGYTYCYDLDQFPRLENHPSYAVDSQNIFSSTYSQQTRKYGESQLCTLINRVYFGLPYTKDEERKGQSKTKNICHYYLFQNEDKKYHLDRMLMEYKKLHKNLSNLLKSGKINSFSLLKKDPDLEDIVRSDRQMPQKLQALAKKIRILQERKRGSINNWYYEDELFFYHSLNQTLHEQIDGLKKGVQLTKMHALLYTNEYYLKTIIEEKYHSPEGFLKSALTYYNSAQTIISKEVFNDLKDKYSKQILSEVNGQPKIAFPVQFFYFGPQDLIDTVNKILAIKIQNENQANFYTAKFAWRKLFKYELSSVRPEKLKIQEYVALAKKLVEQSKYFYKKTATQAELIVTLDQLVDLQALNNEEPGKIVSLFKEGESVEINQRELLIICLYNWICQAFLELLPFSQKYGEEFDQFVTCQLFDKYSHGLVEAVGKPIMGTLKSNIELLCEILGKVDYLGGFDFVLAFQFFKESNLGILRRRKQEENVWQTEKEESEHQEHFSDKSNEDEEVVDSPSKKIKENE